MDLREIFIELLPFLLTGLITWFITWLNNRNTKEKAEIRAQEIVNEQYIQISSDLKAEKDARLKQAEAFAEERGGLNAKINLLDQLVKDERKQREQEGKEQADITSRLSQQVIDLRATQAVVNEKLTEVTKERDRILRTYEIKEQELRSLQSKVEEITLELQGLRNQLDERDELIRKLREELEGRDGHSTPVSQA